jgi:Domain of unknown function (DUF222)/HNH endonuclease
VSWDYDDDGSLLLRGRLPAEEGALVIAAIEAARERARDEAKAAATEHAGASAEAPSPTVGEQRADALLALAEATLADAQAGRSGGDRHQVVVHVDTATLRDGGDDGERCELDNGVPLPADTARRLSCDASLVRLLERDGRPLSVGRKTRSIPPALRRALAARDRGCRFPGCTARRVDAHHIEHWADGGQTKLTNLVQLCRHHHRLLHEGGYALTRGHDGTLTFRRPDGRRVAPCPATPPGRASVLRERRPGDRARAIEPDACRSLSAGERLDLELGVEALLVFAPPVVEAPGI